MRVRWWLVLIPGLLGLITGLVLNLSGIAVPTFYLLADLGTLLLIVGAIISAVGLLAVWLYDRYEKAHIELVIDSAEDRRRFLQRLDHELKNPLTAILAGMANIYSTDLQPEQREILGSVSSQVSRLRTLVGELRKLSDLETRPVERVPVDMNVLLEEAFEIARDINNSDERNLSLSIPQAPWPLPEVNGDYDLLVLATHNLLENAIKFTNPGDTIEVRAFEDGNAVVIEVADTGPGIPQEESQHIWQELYRGSNARGVPGSGLGLALVRAIVARHDGEIVMRSRSDQGTVFTMRLPVNPAEN